MFTVRLEGRLPASHGVSLLLAGVCEIGNGGRATTGPASGQRFARVSVRFGPVHAREDRGVGGV